jgi:threonine dehydrogenase-like Zn-dependent dehydrogenase
VNFYDDLHRRYIEVSGAHGNMLFEPAHVRLAGAWDIDKAQRWLLAELASGRLSTERLVTHTIAPEGIGQAYEGLLKEKDRYLGVVVKWK